MAAVEISCTTTRTCWACGHCTTRLQAFFGVKFANDKNIHFMNHIWSRPTFLIAVTETLVKAQGSMWSGAWVQEDAPT